MHVQNLQDECIRKEGTGPILIFCFRYIFDICNMHGTVEKIIRRVQPQVGYFFQIFVACLEKNNWLIDFLDMLKYLLRSKQVGYFSKFLWPV